VGASVLMYLQLPATNVTVRTQQAEHPGSVPLATSTAANAPVSAETPMDSATPKDATVRMASAQAISRVAHAVTNAAISTLDLVMQTVAMVLTARTLALGSVQTSSRVVSA
jgi:hypothetical protein